MSTQVNYYRMFPFHWYESVVVPGFEISAKEACRLWWLPKAFAATLTYTLLNGETGTIVFDGTDELVRDLDDETQLCLQGDPTASTATYTFLRAGDTGDETVTLRLFKQFTGAAGVWTNEDESEWMINVSVSGYFEINDVLYTFGDATDMDGFDEADKVAVDCDITYKPEATVGAPYTKPPNNTVYLSPLPDVGGSFSITIEESKWFQHGGVWSETAGTVRLREP